MIKDSGERKNFDTGAVRDISEGKGRCDLLPLSEVAKIIGSSVLQYIENFKTKGKKDHIENAVLEFCFNEDIKPDEMMLEVAKHFEEGCNKYGERNWEKGIPIHCYVDSGVRHLLKHRLGYDDERHDRAFVWNMLCLLWTLKNKPELDDFTLKGE